MTQTIALKRLIKDNLTGIQQISVRKNRSIGWDFVHQFASHIVKIQYFKRNGRKRVLRVWICEIDEIIKDTKRIVINDIAQIIRRDKK